MNTYDIFDLNYDRNIIRIDPYNQDNPESRNVFQDGVSPNLIISGGLQGNLEMVDGYIKSKNYKEGVSGWIIRNDGFSQLADLELIGGSLKYGKEDFDDNLHAGYILSPEGFYFGTALDARYLKYDIDKGTLNYVGTISGRESSVIASAINASGNFIDNSLNTYAKQILGEYTFSGSGAIKIADSSNTGLWLNPNGIVGKRSGAVTFAIGSDGKAEFSGDIKASTITGSSLETASSGKRIKIHHDTSYGYGAIDFSDSSGLIGRITPAPSAKGTGMQFRGEAYGWYPTLLLADGSSSAEASITIAGYGLGAGTSYNWSNQDFHMLSSSRMQFSSVAYLYKSIYDSVYIVGTGNITPSENTLFSIGASDKRYLTIHLVSNPTVGSSRKIKKDITNCQYGLKDVVKLQPRRYKLKENNKETIGLVTEEIKEVIPEVLEGDEAYRPSDLIPVLINAIKELNNKIDKLEKQAKLK